MAVYFAVIFLFLGLFLGEILDDLHDKLTPLEVFNGVTLYLLIGAMLLRFAIQSLITINLQSYQSLPIQRKTLVNFILLKPLFSLGNYITLLVIVPFAVRSIPQWFSGWVAVQFVVNCILLIWFNIWISSFLKRKFDSGLKALLIIFVLIMGIAALEYFKIFSLFDISLYVFNFLVINPFGWILTLVLSLSAYYLNIRFFSANFYPEKFNEKLNKGENKITGGLSFLEKHGTIGELIQLQFRLIFRHKRTKSLVYLSAFFMLYGLIFYTSEMYSNNILWLIFCGLIITGMASITYGQWIISWESAYFDTILSKNIPARTYIKANFIILIAFNLISFVLALPYFFLGVKFGFLHIAMFLFNTGINVFLLILTASFNTKRIDLMAKSMLNYQGTTYKSFLIIIPVMFLPGVLAVILNLFLTFNQILLVFGIIGLIGIFLLPLQINLSTGHFNKRKYAMAEGFRKKE
ncbi:MAG: hypothetical protein GX102_11920 [Porphyromonadaceae bacterium]|nr:hypothetical protein [Porphyromonadaceae bacterium]